MTAKKFDSGKPDYTLLEDIHPGVLDDVIRILEFGAEKYSRSNWVAGRGDPEYAQRVHAAVLRHSLASLNKVYDDEHGFPHLCAVIVDALFVESFRRWEIEDAEDELIRQNPEFLDLRERIKKAVLLELEPEDEPVGYTEREVDVFYEGYDCRKQEEDEKTYSPEEARAFFDGYDFAFQPKWGDVDELDRQRDCEIDACSCNFVFGSEEHARSVVDELYVRTSPSRIAGDTDTAKRIKNQYYNHNAFEIAGYCAECDKELTLDCNWVEGAEHGFDSSLKFCSLPCVELLIQWQGRR